MTEGVKVEKFNPTAYRRMPIQVWHDAWRGTDRVLRYVGQCEVCKHRATWEAEDGENDPRGVLGDHATHALVAAEYDMTGPDVPLCAMCGNDYDSYNLALSYARREVWKHPE